MKTGQKDGRYKRIEKQLEELFTKVQNPISRMATISALLHHKFDYYFWTGFYLLDAGELYVGPYQGSLACMHLAKNTGVCWAGIRSGKPVIVGNVHEFPGHIACDSRSKSEIVVPLLNADNRITGVLDVDSKNFDSFDEIDAQNLVKIVNLVYLF